MAPDPRRGVPTPTITGKTPGIASYAVSFATTGTTAVLTAALPTATGAQAAAAATPTSVDAGGYSRSGA